LIIINKQNINFIYVFIIMEWLGNYSIEELEKKGYSPTGKPALLKTNIALVEENELRRAIELKNGKFYYDAIGVYLPNFGVKEPEKEPEICENYIIIIALKKQA